MYQLASFCLFVFIKSNQVYYSSRNHMVMARIQDQLKKYVDSGLTKIISTTSLFKLFFSAYFHYKISCLDMVWISVCRQISRMIGPNTSHVTQLMFWGYPAVLITRGFFCPRLRNWNECVAVLVNDYQCFELKKRFDSLVEITKIETWSDSFPRLFSKE